MVNKVRTKGRAKQVKGSVKEAIGKVTGDRKTEVEGAAEKTAGKLQGQVGKAKDAIRETFKIARNGAAVSPLALVRSS